MMRKSLKSITSLALAVSMTTISTFPALAIPSNDIDFDMLAKAISQRYYADLEMDKLGLDLNEILQLPERDGFFEEVEDLLSDVELPSLGITTRSAASIEPEKTLEAKRLEYAGKMATWSVSKKSNLNYDKEVLYMYLSHYVDVRQPFHSSNGISSNSKGPVYAQYITDTDRKNYANYLSRGSANKSAKQITDLLSLAHGSSGDVKEVYEQLYVVTKKANELVSLGTSCGLDIWDTIEFQDSFAVYYNNGDSAEEIIRKLSNDFEGQFGADKTKLMIKETIGLIGSVIGGTGPIALYIALTNIQLDLGYTLLDEANFLVVRSTYNFRLYDRLKYSYTAY